MAADFILVQVSVIFSFYYCLHYCTCILILYRFTVDFTLLPLLIIGLFDRRYFPFFFKVICTLFSFTIRRHDGALARRHEIHNQVSNLHYKLNMSRVLFITSLAFKYYMIVMKSFTGNICTLKYHKHIVRLRILAIFSLKMDIDT